MEAQDIINGINFTEAEYESVTTPGTRSFNEFINEVALIVRENDGTLEDAIFIAEDAFGQFA